MKIFCICSACGPPGWYQDEDDKQKHICEEVDRMPIFKIKENDVAFPFNNHIEPTKESRAKLEGRG